MKRRESSYVWEHFDKSEQEAICKQCSKKNKLCGNTTNLREHLRRMHCIEDRSQNKSSTEEPECSTSNVSGPREKKFKQTILSTAVVAKELNRKQKINIDTALLQMICADYQPLQMVENTGFINFIKTLQKEICGSDTVYIPPTRKVLTQSLLLNHYEQVYERLKVILKNVNYLSATTDIWTSDSNKSYITVTCHCLYKDKMQSFVLATRELSSPHTGEHIAETLQHVFEEFGILQKIVTIVSDNAQNMKKAINQQLRKHHHPCIAHTLNLSVKETLNSNQDLQNIIQKCRKLVGHFRHSAKSTKILVAKQKQMNMPVLKLKQDIETRWNSVNIMFTRLCEVKAPLTVALTEIDTAPEILDNTEWKILVDCVALLKHIEEITEQLSGEKYPTIGLVIPLIRGLQYNLNTTITETPTGTQLKETLTEVLQRRLGTLEGNKHVAIACLLDPRFKKLGFGVESNAANAQQRCLEELTLITQSSTVTSQQEESSMAIPALEQEAMAKPMSIWDHFEQKKANYAATSTSTTENIITLRQFLELPLLDRKSNPLVYWESMKTNNPGLYQIHLKYSSIPATSVPSERIFSKTGMVTNLRRNRLLPKHLDFIIFLNANWSLLENIK